MLINLMPVRMDLELQALLDGEVLVLNGQPVDLSAVAEGQVRDAAEFGCDWIVGEVTRVKGEVTLTLLLPHGAEAPQETRFPAPVKAKAKGIISLPPAKGAPAAPDLSDMRDLSGDQAGDPAAV